MVRHEELYGSFSSIGLASPFGRLRPALYSPAHRAGSFHVRALSAFFAQLQLQCENGQRSMAAPCGGVNEVSVGSSPLFIIRT